MDAALSFFKRRKTPEQVVEALMLAVRELAETKPEDLAYPTLLEKIDKRVAQAKAFVFGDPEAKEREAAQREEEILALTCALTDAAALPPLLEQLPNYSFETRKNVGAVFTYLLKNDVAGFASVYMSRNHPILLQLLDGYSDAKSALPCGAMLRECLKLPGLHFALLCGSDGDLSAPVETLFRTHVNNPNFEVAADAFETLTALLTQNKELVFEFFNPDGDEGSLRHYNKLVALYSEMLRSDNYVLKRQSLKLLSEFLLDRENFRIMMRFIGDKENLKLIMNMLRHKQANIQFEAFHVFKVFVANPEKPDDITELLAFNKRKLADFLRGFQNDKDDEQFREEKEMLIATLERLPELGLHDIIPSGTPSATPGVGFPFAGSPWPGGVPLAAIDPASGMGLPPRAWSATGAGLGSGYEGGGEGEYVAPAGGAAAGGGVPGEPYAVRGAGGEEAAVASPASEYALGGEAPRG